MAITFNRRARRQIKKISQNSLIDLLLQRQQLVHAYVALLQLEMTPPPPPEYSYRSTQGLVRSVIPLAVVNDQPKVIRRRICDAHKWLQNEQDLYVMTGFTVNEFTRLWNCVDTLIMQSCLRRPGQKLPLRRGSSLQPKERFLLVLAFLRRYPPIDVLAVLFKISRSSVQEWLQMLIPRLAEYLKPEVQFPAEERLKELEGSIPHFSEAIGHMDMTIHRMQMPTVEEWRLFRGDKYCHFFNTLTMVDFTGSFLWVEPGFAGRLLDRQSFELSDLYKQLQESGKKALADNGFKGQQHVITPPKNVGEKLHMSERARQESTYQELHAQFAATTKIWRHKRSLHSPTILLCCELFNFKRRIRMLAGLELWEKNIKYQ